MNKLFLIAVISAAVVVSTATANAKGPKRGMLTWSNEFSYIGLPSSAEWMPELGGGGWGNNELQFYTNNQNAMVKNGKLIITTRKEQYENNEYTSARLISKRAFKYGVIEARLKMPKGRGLWSAFWLIAAKRPLYWPADGEIDIIEHVAFKPKENFAHVHCGKYNHMVGNDLGNSTLTVEDTGDDFHLFTVDWNPKRMVFYLDDQEYFTYYKLENSYESWPFDNEMNIVVNAAVGGWWGASEGIDDSVYPQEFQIDFIRAYEQNLPATETLPTLFSVRSKVSQKFWSLGGMSQEELAANSTKSDYSETFELVRDPEDKNTISMRSLKNRKFLSVNGYESVSADSFTANSDGQKFALVTHSDGSYSLESIQTGRFLKVSDYDQIVPDSVYATTQYEKFEFVFVQV